MEDSLLTGIYNFYRLSDRMASSGQPTESELGAVARAGFDVVVNLALHDADYSLPDERRSVHSFGMRYVHIPVIWERPTRADLEQFVETVDALSDKRLFIHCAANKRVSVFVALYRQLRLGWSADDAMRDVRAIWEPDAVWQRFLEEMIQQLSPGTDRR